MKGKPMTRNQAFAEDFLARLQAIFNYLQPGNIKEQERDGMLFFKQKHTSICLYNVYSGSVQVIFNRNLLSSHFEATHDYTASAPVDWELILVIIIDILEEKGRQEKDRLRSDHHLSRPNRISRSVFKKAGALRANYN